MDDTTNWTPSPEDNKLGLTDKNSINEYEAKGIASAELFIFQLDSETEISVQLIIQIHLIAFSELYDWAGKWRATQVIVGQLLPPEPQQVLNLMYQFIDTLNFKITNATNPEAQLECLIYAHYEFVRIHPSRMETGAQVEYL